MQTTIPQNSKLSEDAERQLAMQIASGSSRALEKLLQANMGFVISIAKQYQNQGVDLDDLVSEGNIAMMMAAQRWNPDKEPKFVLYAVYPIRQAMERIIEKMGTTIIVPKDEPQKISRIDAPLRQGHSRTLGESMSDKDVRTISDTASDALLMLEVMEDIDCLTEREKAVITKYYGLNCGNMTMAEIAEEMNLKRERVRQIRKKAERKLRRPLREIC